MKYATAVRLRRLDPPFKGQAKQLMEVAGQHTCVCVHSAGNTGGLVLDKHRILTPTCHRKELQIHFKDHTVAQATLFDEAQGIGLYEYEGEFESNWVGHDYTPVGALLFVPIGDKLFVYQKLEPEKKCSKKFGVPVLGTPIFTREGTLAGIVSHKPKSHKIGFLTDIPLPI